jgi:hypothetical protein
LRVAHFSGSRWNVGKTYHTAKRPQLTALLLEHQSYKLKKRLYGSGLKQPECEMCGWATLSVDGRIALELDHINAVYTDNRLENVAFSVQTAIVFNQNTEEKTKRYT